MPPSFDEPRGFGRGPRVHDLMTHELVAFSESSIAAERAGDAETALDYHRGIPMFARSGHRALLAQLAGMSEEMTPWLWARWAAYQCTRAEDAGTTTGELQRLALDYAVQMFHGDQMQAAYDEGRDPVPIIARVLGESWVFHQLCTFELGGLDAFLAELATDRLAANASLARSWSEAWMGGYRLLPATDEDAGGLVVRDLADDRLLTVLDLGAELHADEDGWVIGRLVPSGTTPELMFDARPLAVDERAARETARASKRGEWVAVLDRALREGRVDPTLIQSEDRELATDVPGLALVALGTPAGALAGALDGLARGRDEVGRAAFRILREAVTDDEPDVGAAVVAAAVLDPHGFAEARRLLVRPGRDAAWRRWAELAPEPAKGRLDLLAELSAARAA